jgi:two-component system alkaline phosphatase synthesis response regulator PhoP
MSQIKILVVDDEPTLTSNVKSYLEREGFLVRTAADGEDALRAVRAFQPELIVLDIMLPSLDGIEVLRRVRQDSKAYVLMLTAKADETDKVVGLNVGADDYMTKPFSPRELVARIKAILRRGRGDPAAEPVMSFRQLRIDGTAHRVWKSSVEIELTAIEFALLYTLAQHHGHVLSREQLIEHVWGYNYYGDERVADVHIGRVRKKVEDDPANPTLIVTVRGAGYRFEDEPE